MLGRKRSLAYLCACVCVNGRAFRELRECARVRVCMFVGVCVEVEVWVRERVGVQVRKKRQYEFHDHVRKTGRDVVLPGSDHETGYTGLGFRV